MADGCKILVVDDEQSVREGIELILGQRGDHVISTSTGEGSLELVKTVEFDLVLMDLIMPGMDGVEACAKIRAIRPKLKIVAISGSPSGRRMDDFIEAGGLDMGLFKPFGKDKLIEIVDRALAI